MALAANSNNRARSITDDRGRQHQRFRTVSSHECNSAMASSRARGPGGNSLLGAASVSRMACRSSEGALGVTRRLIPRWAISGIPPTRLATHGTPQADASRSTFGTPSEWLGKTNTSTARNQRGNSACGSAARELNPIRNGQFFRQSFEVGSQWPLTHNYEPDRLVVAHQLGGCAESVRPPP